MIKIQLSDFSITDIVLDDNAFNKAVSGFSDISKELNSLRNDIGDMLEDLVKGFDTPAGRVFIESCKKNLLDSLDKQKTVIDYISQNLNDSKTQYQKVFDKYGELQTLIKNL